MTEKGRQVILKLEQCLQFGLFGVLTGGFRAQRVGPTSSASCTSSHARHVQNSVSSLELDI